MQNYICDKCDSIVASKYSLKRHQTRVHGGQLYTSRRKDIIDFVSTVESVNLYSDETICNKCDATFNDSYNLRRHLLEVHEGVRVVSKKRFKCLRAQLGKVAAGNTLMIQNDKVIGSVQRELGAQKYNSEHKSGNSPKVKFVCDLCKTGCKTFKELTLHIHGHVFDNAAQESGSKIQKKGGPAQKYVCTKCSIVFKDRNNLMLHRLVKHKRPKLESKKKAVNQSSSVFKDQSEHNVSQQDESCSIKNDVSNKCDININMPEKGHSLSDSSQQKLTTKFLKGKTTDHICDLCGVHLSNDYNLRRHKIEVHQGIKFWARANDKNIIHFVSTLASVTISSDVVMKRNCDGSKRANCNKCESNFRNLHDLKRHILEVHEGIKVISKKSFSSLKEKIGATAKGNILIIESGEAVGSVTKDTTSNFSCDECTIITRSSAEMIQHHIEKHSNADNVNCELKDRYVYLNKHDRNRGNAYPLKLYTVKTTDQKDSRKTFKQRKDPILIFPKSKEKGIKEIKISDKACLSIPEHDISLKQQSRKSITRSTNERKDHSAYNPSNQEDLTCDFKEEFSDKSDSIKDGISDECSSSKNDISNEYDIIKNNISDEWDSIEDVSSDDSDFTIEKDCSVRRSLKKKAISKPLNKKMRTHSCETCGAILSCDYNLRRHITEVHGGIKYRARADDINLAHFVSTQESVSIQSNESMIKDCNGRMRTICDKCGGTFRDLFGLKKHILEVHDGVRLISKNTFKHLKEQLEGTVKGNVLIIEFGKSVGSVLRESNSMFSCVECVFKAESSIEMIQHHIEVHSKSSKETCKLKDECVNLNNYSNNVDIAFPLKTYNVNTEDQGDNLCKAVTAERESISTYPYKDKMWKEMKFSDRQALAESDDHNSVKQHKAEECDTTILQESVEIKQEKTESKVEYEPHLLNEKKDNTPINKKNSSITCEQCGITLASIYCLKQHRDIAHRSKLQYFEKKNDKPISRSQKLKETVDELQANVSKAFENENIEILSEKTLPVGNKEETKNVICLQFNCKYCGTTFLKKRHILQHLLQVHQGIKCITINTHKRKANSGASLAKNQSLISETVISKSRLFCDKCDLSFNNEVIFRRHLFTVHRCQLKDSVAKSMEITKTAQIHTKQKYLTCSKCGFKIETLFNIKKHYNEAHAKETAKHNCYRSKVKSARTYRKSSFYSCSSCSTTFKTVNEWKNHLLMKICRVGNKITGKHCTNIVPGYAQNISQTRKPNKSQIKTLKGTYILDKSRTRLNTCRYCQKNLSCKRQLKKHENLHAGKAGLRCFACKKLFLCHKYLILHMKSHIQETRLECKTCHKIFKSWKLYLRHVKGQTCKADGYLCEICSKTFKTCSGLNAHRLVHAEIKPEFICGLCAKSFTRRQGLLLHELVHTDDRPIKCDYCDGCFKNKVRLDSHMRMVHRERQSKHACDKCPLSFLYACFLRKHQRRVHLQEKPYCCKLCDKSFAFLKNLQYHMRVHTDERPESCEICGKCFRCKHHLKAHIRMHKGEKLWGCEKCGVRYTDKRSYNRHVERCISE